MSVAAQIVTYVGGILVATLLFRLLSGRIPKAVAVGLAFWVAMLSFYPLRQSAGGRLSFIAWAMWVALVSALGAGLYALLSRRGDRGGT